MESKFSKVKVNNEIELCRVTDMKVKAMIERALLEARISYFIKCEKPGLFSGGRKQSCVFQVNEWQIELAEQAIANLGDEAESKIKYIMKKTDTLF